MSDVLFIQELFTEYMGIMYISAVLKQNHISTDILISKNIRDIINYVSICKPKIIGFSVITGLHKFPVTVSKIIKKEFPDIKIIAGGAHPTFFQEYINEDVFDAICVGEGEYPMLYFYKYTIGEIDIDAVPNIIFKKNGKIYRNKLSNLIEDLDSIPFADRELYDKYEFFKNYPTKSVLCLKGCPYNCSYCYNGRMKEIYRNKGKYVRTRDPQKIIEGILILKQRYRSLSTISFTGDVFFYDKKWVKELLMLYKEKINLPYITSITANFIDEEIGKLLRISNCKGMYFGIESGNEWIRKEILNKNISNQVILKTAQILRKNKIPYRTYNILGLPTETIENMLETINLNVKIKTNYPWCSIFIPYPGTRLYEIAKENGEIESDFSINDIPPSFMEKSVLKRKDVEQIENLHKFFITAVKFPFLIPLIKKIIKLKPNIIFKLWFGLTYALSIMFSEHLSFKDVIMMVLENYKFFISSRRKNFTREEKL